ncbi:MAG: M20/M25/M40 family metallo-hydrolase [Nannocystales bacterium]
MDFRAIAGISVVLTLGCKPGPAPETPAPPEPPTETAPAAAAQTESPPAASVVAVEQPPSWAADAAEKIFAAAHGKTRGWDRLAEMTDLYGHRLSGSQALEDSIGWTLDTMRADGQENVRKEKVMVPHWVRGKESLRMASPVRRDLTMIGLGMSVGTRGTLTREVIVVDHVEAIAKLDDNAAKGKIVLINQVMPPYDPQTGDSHYGDTVQSRTRGASEAAKKGADAVLVRSVTAHSLDTPHTGTLVYADGVRKIPAAAVTVEAAEFLSRTSKRGPVKVSLKMGAKLLPDAASGNAIAEIVGREKPEEVVVIGGHIDSWDVGDGSSDDGAGCMAAMEAALLIREAGLQPRRTIRVVLFTNEENGLRGGLGYFDAHGTEPHVGAIESDSGMGAPTGFSLAGDDADAFAALQVYQPLFSALGDLSVIQGWGGADISPLTKNGVLSMALRPDASHYFDLHHSPADTIEKIDPAHIEGNAAAMALMAYILAERE